MADIIIQALVSDYRYRERYKLHVLKKWSDEEGLVRCYTEEKCMVHVKKVAIAEGYLENTISLIYCRIGQSKQDLPPVNETHLAEWSMGIREYSTIGWMARATISSTKSKPFDIMWDTNSSDLACPYLIVPAKHSFLNNFEDAAAADVFMSKRAKVGKRFKT